MLASLSALLVAAAPAVAATVGPEIGHFDPSTGQWYMRDAVGATHNSYFGVPGDVPLLGDWDCDRIDTVGMDRPSNGFVYLRNSNTQGIAEIDFFYGVARDIPLAGDWDRDRCDTLAIYRGGRVFVRNSLGTGVADYSFNFGSESSVAMGPIQIRRDDGAAHTLIGRPDDGVNDHFRSSLLNGRTYTVDPAGSWTPHFQLRTDEVAPGESLHVVPSGVSGSLNIYRD